MSGLISCVSWIKKGVATQHPEKYVLDEAELERISALSRVELEEMKKEVEKAQRLVVVTNDEEQDEDEEQDDTKRISEETTAEDPMDEDVNMDATPPKPHDPNDLTEYKLDEYDEGSSGAAGAFTNVGRLTYYQDGEEDPYVTLKEDDDDEEREALEVLPSDNMIVTARTEDDVSQLEIYIYDETQPKLYVHHDIMLPSFPLCLEWLDFPPHTPSSSSSDPTKSFGNYVAVGTFDPEIEIWSMDSIEQMYPDTVLGRPDKTVQHVPGPLGTGKKKRKKSKPRQVDSSHHVDAVLSLSWNRSHRNLLASASADKTVKLWDLSRDPLGEHEGAIRSFDLHRDKVQAVQWNATEPTVLLTGSYDRTVRMFDTRSPDQAIGTVVGADVEVLRWNPFETHSFMVALENGLVLDFDARTLPSDLNSPSPARWTLSAHDGAVSSLDINPHLPGCLVTGGTDKLVKVWNVTEEEDKRRISIVTSRNLEIGKVFSVQWSPDDPLTLAAAGTKGSLQVWDVGANAGVQKTFGPKLRAAGRQLRVKSGDGLVTMENDDEGDESEWEDEE